MIDTDKKPFLEKIVEMASIVGRGLKEEDISAYFNHLKDFPLDVVLKAMHKAYYNRDPKDYFNQRTMVTVAEIRNAADEILMTGASTVTVGCAECNGTGYVLKDKEDGQPMASRCECLQKVRQLRADKKAEKK